MIHKYCNEWMPLNIVKNLYVPFGIPFDPKLFYKDGAYTSIAEAKDMKLDMTERLTMEHTDAQGQVLFTSYAWRALLVPDGGIETGIEGTVVNVPTCWHNNLLNLLLVRKKGGAQMLKVRGLTTIDIDELIRLRICERLRDVVTWVALRLHRQQVGAAGEATQVDPKALLKEDGG
ncbi:hypothetical protein Tco_0255884 [Tanacetum coccineum]